MHMRPSQNIQLCLQELQSGRAFWFVIGVRSRASHANSSVCPNCTVDSAQRDMRGSSACTYARRERETGAGRAW